MDTTQVTLLSLEAVGPGWLPRTAAARGERARSLEHQQVGARSLAAVKDPRARTRTTGTLLQQSGVAKPRTPVGIEAIEPPCT